METVVLGNIESLPYLHPELVLMIFTVFAVLADITFPRRRALAVCTVTVLGLGVALGSMVPFLEGGNLVSAKATFMGTMAHDGLGLFFKGYLIVAALIVALASLRSSEVGHVSQGEYFALILAVTAFSCLLATSVDLLMIYLALEMVSITSYIMVGTARSERISNEASLKYLLFGAAASGAMLYGMSLVYGLTGSTNLHAIRQALGAATPSPMGNITLLLAGVFILAGFGFKIASVPFHFWCPDVYQGAPTPVTAFLSVGPKAAGFAILIRFFFPAGAPSPNMGDMGGLMTEDWTSILVSLCLVTMTVGNVAALTQRNLKRMLAYSSIAHAGYMLMGALLLTQDGAEAIVIYLIAYLFMNVGAFLVVIAVYDSEGSFDVSAFNGLYRRNPWLAVTMTIFLLSLIGFPPLAGFMGKLYLFLAVLRHGQTTVAIIAAVNSVIAVWYYLRVVRAMVIDESPAVSPVRVGAWNWGLIIAMAVPTVMMVFVWRAVALLAAGATSIIATAM